MATKLNIETPLHDFFFNILMSEENINTQAMRKTINEVCFEILTNVMGIDEEDLIFFDYTLKYGHDKNHIIVSADNIVTALWFAGIMPSNCHLTMKKNLFHYKGGEYKFNKKTKTLSYSKNK